MTLMLRHLVLSLLAAAPVAADVVVFRDTLGIPFLTTLEGDAWSEPIRVDGEVRGLDACGDGAGRIVIAARGTDDAVWVRTYEAGAPVGGWHPVGGLTREAPAVTCGAGGRIDVFVRGTDDALWHAVSESGQWRGFASVGGSLSADPDAALLPDGTLVVLTLDGRFAMRTATLSAGAWTWTMLGGEFRSSPAIASLGDGRVLVAGRGMDDAPWFAATRPTVAPTGFRSGPGTLAGGIDATALSPGRVRLVSVGTDARVWSSVFADDALGGWRPVAAIPVSTDAAVAPGAFVRPAAARGRFRITITGIGVERATVDHALDVDGKGDEVYVKAFVGEVERAVDARFVPVLAERVSLTHGDVNGIAGRIQAGSLSDRGGLKDGDAFPSYARGGPWSTSGEPTTDRLPLLAWEGELREGGNAVVLFPAVWEDDGDPALHRADRERTQRAWPSIAAEVARMVGVWGDEPRWVAAGFEVWRHVPPGGGGGGDRPVGMRRSADSDKFTPPIVALDYVSARATSRREREGLPAGVFEVRFTDSEDLRGEYTLYIRVEER